MSAQRDNLLKRCDCDSAKWPKCPHGWHLVMRHDGERFSVSLDRDCTRRGLQRPENRGDAETLAGIVSGAIGAGTYEERPKSAALARGADGLTVEQAAHTFLTEKLAPKDLVSFADEEGRYRKISNVTVPGVGRLGAVGLVDVTEAHVQDAFGIVTKGLANNTKKKYQRAFKRLFRWAVTKKHLASSPITEDTVMHAGKGVMRTRRVRPEEEADLIAAASDTRVDATSRLAGIIIAAIELGARLGELLALQWADVLWDSRRIRIRAVESGARKNGKSRIVPLTARLEAVLLQLQVSPTGKTFPSTAYVFGDAIGGRVRKIRKAWMTCALRACHVLPAWAGTKLDAASLARFQAIDLHFHDLRHEAALRWLERGYKLNTIATLLGHSDLNTLRVYLGIAEEDALEEAERLSAQLPAPAPVTLRGRDGKLLTVQPAANRQQTGKTGRLLAHPTKGGSRRQAV